MSDDYAFYWSQMAGENPETTPGTPHCGYYRRRIRATVENANPEPGAPRKNTTLRFEPVAIWKDGDKFRCMIGNRDLSHLPDDAIDTEIFARVCRDAIPYEVYTAVMGGAPWPDEVAERAADAYGSAVDHRASAAEPAKAEIGHNSGEVEPFIIMRERIQDVRAQVAEWFKGIGGALQNDEQADKAANFSILIGEIEKEAVAAHKREKEPWLTGGRKVDAAWKPVIDAADAAKRAVKIGIITPYLREKQKQADEAARLPRAQSARRAREAAEAGAPEPEAPAPEIQPAKVKAGTRDARGVSLRKTKVVEVHDLPAFSAYLAAMESPPPDFVQTCNLIANRMAKAGVEAPGVSVTESSVAA